ncbi:hypothetical protein [Bathymodiolus platifrons methanotrophic gill symbiont]|uniref:hypothetical protein n=1 Tax=Bathymodiolus platifrons methanotrophic gill symbiont TaxID=113268 RepID=UPI001C8D6515|nr:hypothetical protein [Bathymodiolus platifrons methanotrophic gill symbiont]
MGDALVALRPSQLLTKPCSVSLILSVCGMRSAVHLAFRTCKIFMSYFPLSQVQQVARKIADL